jgi:hypothetical protein
VIGCAAQLQTERSAARCTTLVGGLSDHKLRLFIVLIYVVVLAPIERRRARDPKYLVGF